MTLTVSEKIQSAYQTLNSCYSMVAGRVIQLTNVGEEKAADNWNAEAQKMNRGLNDLVCLLPKVKSLEILAEGCKTHPSYRAKRAPQVECPECEAMWNARRLLEAESATESA